MKATRSAAVVIGLFVVAGVGASELEDAADMESESRIERKLGDKEIRVTLSSANIADCKAKSAAAPAAPASPGAAPAELADRDATFAAKSAPDCANGVQLSVRSGEKAKPSKITLKSVELYEGERKIGTLAAKAPKAWDGSGEYRSWNEKAVPGKELLVSYEIAEPDWSTTEDRKNKTFRIRVTMSVAGENRALEEDVAIDAEISLPPDVVT